MGSDREWDWESVRWLLGWIVIAAIVLVVLLILLKIAPWLAFALIVVAVIAAFVDVLRRPRR